MENQYKHPNPQFARTTCQDLNGEWDFGFKKAARGFRFSKDFSRAEKLCAAASYPHKIRVPFCPESRLSGVGYTDFMPAVWYSRTVELPAEWQTGGRVLLHFGAVDWRADVYVNGTAVGFHTGGYTPFSFDITKLLKDGENTLTVKVFDPTDTRRIPAGKQVLKPSGCRYTAVSGIWQTVWLEAVPQLRIENLKITPNLDAGRFEVKAETNDNLSADKISVKDKAIIIGALGYLISPLDVIPDAIPIAGLGDDLAVLVYVLNKVWGNVSEEIKDKAKSKLGKWFDEDEIKEIDTLFDKE